jgi:hypothetical protein
MNVLSFAGALMDLKFVADMVSEWPEHGEEDEECES